MFDSIKELAGFELILFKENDESIKTLRVLVIKKITSSSILVIPIDDKYIPIVIMENDVIGCSPIRLPEHIYSKAKEMAIAAKNIDEIEANLANEKRKYLALVSSLRNAVFIDKYTPAGACTYLNNVLNGKALSVNDNIITLNFFKGDEKDCLEVSIRISKKFEYFNITSENDIEKAADTYAPVIRDEIIKQFPMFRDIFIVNKSFKKLGDYLYESYCEYNASMDCNRTNFFEKVSNILGIMNKEVL